MTAVLRYVAEHRVIILDEAFVFALNFPKGSEGWKALRHCERRICWSWRRRTTTTVSSCRLRWRNSTLWLTGWTTRNATAKTDSRRSGFFLRSVGTRSELTAPKSAWFATTTSSKLWVALLWN